MHFGTAKGIWLQVSMLGQDVYEANSGLSAISYHLLDANCFFHAEKWTQNFWALKDITETNYMMKN